MQGFAKSGVTSWARAAGLGRGMLAVSVVVGLLALAIANIAVRSSWSEVEDGVLWVSRAEGVVAAEIGARSTAAAAGIRRGDVLLAIDGQPVESPDEVVVQEREKREAYIREVESLKAALQRLS